MVAVCERVFMVFLKERHMEDRVKANTCRQLKAVGNIVDTVLNEVGSKADEIQLVRGTLCSNILAEEPDFVTRLKLRVLYSFGVRIFLVEIHGSLQCIFEITMDLLESLYVFCSGWCWRR